MVVVAIIILSLGCFLDLVVVAKNFDNIPFRENLLVQATAKILIVAILLLHLYIQR